MKSKLKNKKTNITNKILSRKKVTQKKRVTRNKRKKSLQLRKIVGGDGYDKSTTLLITKDDIGEYICSEDELIKMFKIMVPTLSGSRPRDFSDWDEYAKKYNISRIDFCFKIMSTNRGSNDISIEIDPTDSLIKKLPDLLGPRQIRNIYDKHGAPKYMIVDPNKTNNHKEVDRQFFKYKKDSCMLNEETMDEMIIKLENYIADGAHLQEFPDGEYYSNTQEQESKYEDMGYSFLYFFVFRKMILLKKLDELLAYLKANHQKRILFTSEFDKRYQQIYYRIRMYCKSATSHKKIFNEDFEGELNIHIDELDTTLDYKRLLEQKFTEYKNKRFGYNAPSLENVSVNQTKKKKKKNKKKITYLVLGEGEKWRISIDDTTSGHPLRYTDMEKYRDAEQKLVQAKTETKKKEAEDEMKSATTFDLPDEIEQTATMNSGVVVYSFSLRSTTTSSQTVPDKIPKERTTYMRLGKWLISIDDKDRGDPLYYTDMDKYRNAEQKLVQAKTETKKKEAEDEMKSATTFDLPDEIIKKAVVGDDIITYGFSLATRV